MISEVHVMVDLETLGTSAGSPILSIGAVAIKNGEIFDEFHRHIDWEDSIKTMGPPMPDTIAWWMEQSDEARKKLCDGRRQAGLMKDVLAAFWLWFRKVEGDLLWGNGAAFDNALLSEAYKKVDQSHQLEQPWEFWNDRCYRTLKSLYPSVPLPTREGTHHDALDDARTQGRHLIALLKKLPKES